LKLISRLSWLLLFLNTRHGFLGASGKSHVLRRERHCFACGARAFAQLPRRQRPWPGPSFTGAREEATRRLPDLQGAALAWPGCQRALQRRHLPAAPAWVQARPHRSPHACGRQGVLACGGRLAWGSRAPQDAAKSRQRSYTGVTSAPRVWMPPCRAQARRPPAPRQACGGGSPCGRRRARAWARSAPASSPRRRRAAASAAAAPSRPSSTSCAAWMRNRLRASACANASSSCRGSCAPRAAAQVSRADEIQGKRERWAALPWPHPATPRLQDAEYSGPCTSRAPGMCRGGCRPAAARTA